MRDRYANVCNAVLPVTGMRVPFTCVFTTEMPTRGEGSFAIVQEKRDVAVDVFGGVEQSADGYRSSSLWRLVRSHSTASA